MTMNLQEPVFCFASDLDWNPDAAVRATLDLFARHQAKLTVFATHQTDLLAESPNLQIGLHPNFLPGSTHGGTMKEVLDHVFGLYPGARTYRSHSYFDNQQLSEEMTRRGIRYDANLALYMQEGLRPLRHCHGSWRFPSFFDDNVHWYHGGSWRLDDIKDQLLTPGLKIFNFHPYPIALNLPSYEHYVATRPLFKTLTAEEIRAHRFNGPGPETFLEELLSFLKPRFPTYLLSELYDGLIKPLEQTPVQEIRGRPAMDRDYAGANESERKNLVRGQYEQMDALNPYSTSRDFHLRELEIEAIARWVTGGTVLDCGCANGYTLLSLGKRLQGADLLGVDFSENLVKGAMGLRERFRPDLKSVPEFTCRDVFDFIRTDTRTFDFILTERLVVNLPSAEAQDEVITGLIAKLRPGGAFLLVEGSQQGFQALNRLRAGAGLEVIPDVYPGNESSRKLDENRLRRVVQQSGSSRIEAEENFSFYNLVSKIVHPLLVAPDAPKFSARINGVAAAVHANLMREGVMLPDVGAGKLWIIRKDRGQ